MLKNEGLPVDLLLLAAPHQKESVFIDTMNLDGETNLKERVVPFKPELFKEDNFDGYVLIERPSANLEKWDANLFCE